MGIGSFFCLLRKGGSRRHSLLSSPSSHFSPRQISTKQNSGDYIRFRKHSQSHFFSSTATTFTLFDNGFVSWYLRMIETRPVLTKSVTAGVIFTAADISSQVLTLKPSNSFDLMRTLRMAGYGVLISGPSLHLWFNFVSRTIPKRDLVNTLKKIFLGQTTFGPIMTTVFFSVNAALRGESGDEIVARLKRDMIPTMINGLIYWPMCDFVTFKFVPVRLQPLVSNSFSFLWTIYITYMASLKKADWKKIQGD